MFRGLVLIFVLTAGAANAQGISHDSGSHQRSEHARPKPKPESQPSDLVAIIKSQNEVIGRAIETLVNKQPSQEEKDEASRNLAAQENLAYWARMMFWVGIAEIAVTVLGVIFVARTLITTRRIGQAQVRAYLSCDNAQYIVMPAGFWCWPDIRNTGQSPAKNIELRASITVSDFPEGKEGKVIRQEKTSGVPPIPAGQTDNGMFAFPDVQLRPEEIDDFGRPLLISCLLSWDDVFDQRSSIAFDLVKTESADAEGEGPRRRLVGVMRPLHRTPNSDEELRREKRGWRGFSKSDEEKQD